MRSPPPEWIAESKRVVQVGRGHGLIFRKDDASENSLKSINESNKLFYSIDIFVSTVPAFYPTFFHPLRQVRPSTRRNG